MQRIINEFQLGQKQKCIFPFLRKGQISRNFIYFREIRLFWSNFLEILLVRKFHFSENSCNIHIFAKIIKVLLKNNSIHSAARIYQSLVLIFAKIFRKLTFSLKYVYIRQKNFSRKRTLSRKSVNFSCHPNIFPEMVPLSYILLKWSLCLTSANSFFSIKLNQHQQLFPFCPAHLLLSCAYVRENILKTDIFAQIYIRQKKFSRKQTLSRKSVNISCRPNVFPEMVPLSYMLLTSLAFFQ